MSVKTLHWIIDPICGWSYGALPLINAIQMHFETLQNIYFGGLYIENSRQKMTSSLRDTIIKYDHHIHQLTGVEFGNEYKNELLNNSAFILDSLPATQYLLTAKRFTNIQQTILLLNKIQIAYYQNGLDITSRDVLQQLVHDAGFDPIKWRNWLSQIGKVEVEQEFLSAHQLMIQVESRGFPTLVLETDNGEFIKFDVSKYYQKPESLTDTLYKQLS